MSLEKLLDEQIRNAIENGEFDNLKGAGKPLDLDEYFAAPADVRAAWSLLKNNDFIPEEVGLLKQIADLRDRLKVCSDTERPDLNELLNERSLALAMILERNRARR